jgi:hypothetical protein
LNRETKKLLAQVLVAIFSILFLAEYVSTKALQNLNPEFRCQVSQVINYYNNVSFYYCNSNCLEILENYSGPGIVELLRINGSPLVEPCILVSYNATLESNNCKKVYLAQGICKHGSSEFSVNLLVIYNLSNSNIRAKIYDVNGYLIGVEE